MTLAASHDTPTPGAPDPLELVAPLAGSDRNARDLLSHAFEVVVADAGVVWNRVLACAPEGVVGVVDHFLHLVDDVRTLRSTDPRPRDERRMLRRHVVECLWRLTTITAPCAHCLDVAADLDGVRPAVVGCLCAEHGRHIVKTPAPAVRGMR